jgi:hypothetical protein
MMAERLVAKIPRFLIVALALSCAAGARAGPIPPDASAFPFVQGTDPYAPPALPMPAKGASFVDPSFHTTITRLTDKGPDGYSGPGIENEYATSSPENADGTRLILRGNDGSWYLYNATSFKLIEVLSDTIFRECAWVEPDPRWDNAAANLFYYLCSRDDSSTIQLRRYDLQSSAMTVVHDFKSDFPAAASITTHSYGDASMDRRYWCLLAQNSSYDILSVFVYDKTTDSIVGQKSGGFPDKPRSVQMGPSGNQCVVGFENLTYAQVYSRDFTQGKDLPDGSNGHSDVARTAAGRDVLVYQNVRTDFIAMADLQTGAETRLVPIPFNVNEDIGLHISGNCTNTPGWVMTSTYGAKNAPPGQSHSWMDTQLFMVELAPNPRIWRIAHTHAYTALDYEGQKNYFAEAFAAINRQGTSIYFGSNWGSQAADSSETYKVSLPADWAASLNPSQPTSTPGPPAPASTSGPPSPSPTQRPCAACTDSDFDGVPDCWDQCPDTGSGRYVDSNGCPSSGASLLWPKGMLFLVLPAALASGRLPFPGALRI